MASYGSDRLIDDVFADEEFCKDMVELYIAAIILYSEAEGLSHNEAHKKVSDWLDLNEIHGQLDENFGTSTLH